MGHRGTWLSVGCGMPTQQAPYPPFPPNHKGAPRPPGIEDPRRSAVRVKTAPQKGPGMGLWGMREQDLSQLPRHYSAQTSRLKVKVI